MRRFLLALALAVPVAASAVDYHTVEWFRDHPDARRATIYWCRNNAGIAPHNPNCVNAENGGLLAEERRLWGNGQWAAGSDQTMLNTCRVLREKGITATPIIADSCRELHAPGY